MNAELGREMGKGETGAFAGGSVGAQPQIREIVPSTRIDVVSRIPFVRRFQEKAPVVEPQPVLREATEFSVAENPWTLTGRPSLSIMDMTGGVLPNVLFDYELDAFKRHAKEPQQIFSVTKTGSDDTTYVSIGSPLTAKDANNMLYYPSPQKWYGRHTKDIIADWRKLYGESPRKLDGQKKLYAAHAGMPGWKQFEQGREQFLELLERNFKDESFDEQDPSDVIVPVIQFERTKDDGMQIVLDPLDEELRELIAQALPGTPNTYHSGIGMMQLASYSYDNAQWLLQSGFQSWTATDDNTMGPAQIMGLAYREVAKAQAGVPVPKEHDLQQSPLLRAMADYADTGLVTPVYITPKEERQKPSRWGKLRRR